jgi:peptide subunit release factor 1 (eRF1)
MNFLALIGAIKEIHLMQNCASKVNGRNGRGGQFARELDTWLDELAAAENLRAGALRQITQLRKEVYRRAARHGVSARVLRAAHALRQNGQKGAQS